MVGPWSRLSNQSVVKNEFLQYLKFIRSHDFVNKIIYSSSDEEGVVPSFLFDEVCSNCSVRSGVEDMWLPARQNNNTAIFIKNSCIGIQKSNSEYVIKVRSDLYIKNLSLIKKNLIENPGKIIVDYHVSHSLLIPFYYPDFMFASHSKMAKKIFNGEFVSSNFLSEKKIVASPFKSLHVGRMPVSFTYTEYSLWSFLLNNYSARSVAGVKLMTDLTVLDFIRSVDFLKSNIIFISRNDFFCESEKFKFRSSLSAVFFKDGRLNMSLLYVLFAYHCYLFANRSIVAFFKKMTNLIKFN